MTGTAGYQAQNAPKSPCSKSARTRPDRESLFGNSRCSRQTARARIRGVIVDTSRHLQSVYVPVGDGVSLAVDVWLPVEPTAMGGTVGTVMRVTRYHRAEAPQEPGPEADTNAAAGDLFNRAGFALVVMDARGTGASFGTRTGELGEREIKDYGELIGWVAAQPWSNGRVGVYGTSYEGQAAELIAGSAMLTWSRWQRCSARMTPTGSCSIRAGAAPMAGTRGGCMKASSRTALPARWTGSPRSPVSQRRRSRCRRR